MLSPIKEWAEQIRAKVEEHNASLEAIKRKVLMTVEEEIKEEVNRKTQLIADELAQREETERQNSR
jgi:hypothetical protein